MLMGDFMHIHVTNRGKECIITMNWEGKEGSSEQSIMLIMTTELCDY